MTTLSKLIEVLDRDNFVILDTETTGLKRGEVCQIAICNSNGNLILDTLVKTKEPIPHDATLIHGITDEMVKDSYAWPDINAKLGRLIAGRDVLIYNASYDCGIMNQSCIRWGIPLLKRFEWSDQVHCVMEAYAEFNGAWSAYHQSYTFVRLATAFRQLCPHVKDQFKPHTASGDVMMTYDVCLELQRIMHARSK